MVLLELLFNAASQAGGQSSFGTARAWAAYLADQAASVPADTSVSALAEVAGETVASFDVTKQKVRGEDMEGGRGGEGRVLAEGFDEAVQRGAWLEHFCRHPAEARRSPRSTC